MDSPNYKENFDTETTKNILRSELRKSNVNLSFSLLQLILILGNYLFQCDDEETKQKKTRRVSFSARVQVK